MSLSSPKQLKQVPYLQQLPNTRLKSQLLELFPNKSKSPTHEMSPQPTLSLLFSFLYKQPTRFGRQISVTTPLGRCSSFRLVYSSSNICLGNPSHKWTRTFVKSVISPQSTTIRYCIEYYAIIGNWVP